MDGWGVESIYLEEIGISERCAETKDEVTLRMLGYGLHDGPVDDDEMLGCGFDVAALAGVARVEQERRPFQTDPIAAPAALPGQLHLVFLAQQPFLHAQKPVHEAERDDAKSKKKENRRK
jgi:hypothetical protein